MPPWKPLPVMQVQGSLMFKNPELPGFGTLLPQSPGYYVSCLQHTMSLTQFCHTSKRPVRTNFLILVPVLPADFEKVFNQILGLSTKEYVFLNYY